jgi:hypothetical protein
MKLLVMTLAVLLAAGGAAFAAQGEFEVITGKVMQSSGNKIVLQGTDRTYEADLTGAINDAQRQGRTLPTFNVGDTVTVAGYQGKRPDIIEAVGVDSGTGTASAPAAPGGGWQKIHGHVQGIQGSRLTFATDDGRTLNVDMAQVSPNVQRALTQGEGALLVGHAMGTNDFQARWIQQDSSNPRYGGRAVGQPSAQVTTPAPAPLPAPAPAPSVASNPATSSTTTTDKAWEKIHGHVQSISGSTLTLKADDGKMLTVDASKVSGNVMKAITQGEAVTVVGHFQGDTSHIAAQYIQQDRAGGSASPPTAPKK